MSPYDPQQSPPPQGMNVQYDSEDQGGQQGQQPGLFDRWNSWIDKPGNRAAMMQMGIAMLQPMQPGENLLSHAANALGYGGEAEARVAAQQQREDVLESQARLREAQGEAAGVRAGAAQTSAEAAGERAEFARYRLGQEQGQRGLQNIIGAQRVYQAAKDKYDKLENDPFNTARTGQPFPNFEDWMAKNMPGIDPRTGVGVSPIAQPENEPPTRQQPQQKPSFSELGKDKRYAAAVDRFIKAPPEAKSAMLKQLAPYIRDADAVAKQYNIQIR